MTNPHSASAKPILGDPAPWFSATTISGGRIDLHVDAGRYIVLSFLGCPADPQNIFDVKLGQLLRHAPLFREDHIVCYGVLDSRPADGSMYWLMNRPGLAFIADYEGAVARLFQVEGIPCTIVLDPMLRMIAFVPFDHPEGHADIISKLLRSLPPPQDHAGVDLHAPALIVPRVFEFELCDFLIKYQQHAGGSNSGFILDQNNVSYTLIDHRLKRRTDCAVGDPMLMRELRDRIARRLVPAMEQAFSFRPTRIDRCILARYSASTNDHFFRHRDNVNAAAAHRRFAVTINLNGENNCYQGGDLRFPEFGTKTYRVPTGSAIAFSCGLLHEVTPITQGDRFAFLAFLYGEEDAERRLADNAKIAPGARLYEGSSDILIAVDPRPSEPIVEAGAAPSTPSDSAGDAIASLFDGPAGNEPDMTNMIPIGVQMDGTHPAIDWIDLGDGNFTAPFFNQTIAEHVRLRPGAARRRTAADALLDAAAAEQCLTPAGFIFHMSKCGSTLVSRALAALPENLVLSEPEPLNDVLGPALKDVPATRKRELLHLLIRVLGRPRTSIQKRYFIKFSSWNTLFLPFLPEEYSNLPKLFVYRDPVEVMVSVLNDPPGWLKLKSDPVAAGSLTGYPPGAIAWMTAEEYCARLLARILECAIAAMDESWMLLNYCDLPEAAWSRVPAFLKASPLPGQIEEIRGLEAIHAKDPTGTRKFTDDRATKQKAASPEIRAAVERWLEKPYRQIEKMRLAAVEARGVMHP